MTPRARLSRDDAETTYIRAGELEVFRQLRRDAMTLDETPTGERVPALGPFARLRTDAVGDELGKTRGAINHLWGSQEAYRTAIMAAFLDDAGLGLDEVELPDPRIADDLATWISCWAQAEVDRGPRHGVEPENRYGLRWAAWLGLVPYGIWSDTVARPSMAEFRRTVHHVAHEMLAPAFEHFGWTLVDGTTIEDVALAATSAIEGCWLNAALTDRDPIGRDFAIAQSLARTLGLIVRGAVRPLTDTSAPSEQ
jgi:hypothetical protein